MGSSIIFIGPPRVGKSTVCRLFAQRLGMPCCSLGEISGKYFEEAGIDTEAANRLMKESGFGAAYRYPQALQVVYSRTRALSARAEGPPTIRVRGPAATIP